ncbi:hypothetical protein NITMOv2_2256 [Nitrospira moscoviensis]|uniref:DUF2283 domain-containing protein n=1 Tax=Nitrospira moscoviensis TaxID=42253 RepID=A0A0K2GDH8_NITMO|nr:hypothetical protein NITMOv2_2256 [Nitrospira moscoviensis]
MDNAIAVESQEVSPGIIVDYSEQDTVVGIEMLHLSKRTPKLDVATLEFETVPAPPTSQH